MSHVYKCSLTAAINRHFRKLDQNVLTKDTPINKETIFPTSVHLGFKFILPTCKHLLYLTSYVYVQHTYIHTYTINFVLKPPKKYNK